VELGFVSSSSSLPCLLPIQNSLLKYSMHIDRQSGRQKIVNMKKRIGYLKRRFGRWWKRKRDGNRRRRRTGDKRKKRGRGGSRQPRRSMLGRRSWRRHDREKEK
jgi:hypothetical protein